jgi:hypothetical protein
MTRLLRRSRLNTSRLPAEGRLNNYALAASAESNSSLEMVEGLIEVLATRKYWSVVLRRRTTSSSRSGSGRPDRTRPDTRSGQGHLPLKDVEL